MMIPFQYHYFVYSDHKLCLEMINEAENRFHIFYMGITQTRNIGSSLVISAPCRHLRLINFTHSQSYHHHELHFVFVASFPRSDADIKVIADRLACVCAFQ